MTSWPHLFEVRDPATLSRPQWGMVTDPLALSGPSFHCSVQGSLFPATPTKGGSLCVGYIIHGPHYTVQHLHSTMPLPTNAIVTRHCIVVKYRTVLSRWANAVWPTLKTLTILLSCIVSSPRAEMGCLISYEIYSHQIFFFFFKNSRL